MCLGRVDYIAPPPLFMQVAFPMQLDCYPYCSEELQSKLNKPRAAKRRLDDRALEQVRP